MPVTIVGETLARRWFPAGAIGKRILLGAPHPGASWMTIVGIAADVKTGALDQPAMPQFYTPAAQDPPFSATIVLRSAAAPAAIARQAAAAVRRLDAELPVFDVSTIEERIARSIGQPRYQGSLAGFFALAALLLAAVGVYGVVAQDTARRKKDNAIRIALGAGAGRIMGTELARGLRPVLAGAAAGACGAALTTRLLTRELFGITPLDPTAFLAAVALLASAAACACLIPARRSARQNPAGILRAD
jgi:putative ABC transport system permease protein